MGARATLCRHRHGAKSKPVAPIWCAGGWVGLPSRGRRVLPVQSSHECISISERSSEMLSERTTKARAAAQFGKITSRDRDGRVKTVLVPGSDGKQYQVILRRSPGLSTECRLDTGHGHLACKSNANGYICYHSMAALTLASIDKGLSVRFCTTEYAAALLARLGGIVVPVISRQGIGRLWIVAKGD